MPTPIDLFDYQLPPELIAQQSVEPRDHSRLMILDRTSGQMQHRRFFEIVHELHAGDVLVLNNTKVFKARLRGTVRGAEIELFLLRAENAHWSALLKPARRVHVGDTIDLHGLEGTLVKKLADGTVELAINASAADVLAFADLHGEVPTPPYVKQGPTNLEQYQTVYAKQIGSVAAPTAGFHFTKRLLQELKEKGVSIEFVTLHVGLGTFRPIKTETLEEHKMHAEFVQIEAQTAQRINAAKTEGRRIIAVGTTTVRTLESVSQLVRSDEVRNRLPADGFAGDINLFIRPGFDFHIIDALITNFHLPKSSLLVLVSAFAGREHILRAYEEAVRERYRFYSFGDAMFVK